ncbi:hypothetical protein [Krasilnikovia sp. M28-CT-15]|uniref:hypothetical protein n=1 Tax=Krasilnikovia sp. M28-CT-15 TaxID=3373540 RepID=UPI00399CD6A0
MTKANRRNPWMMALYAVLVAYNAFGLGQELLGGDPVWWKVALRLLGLSIFGFAFHAEMKKPKAEPVSR